MSALIPGLDILEECEGDGHTARAGDTVVFETRIFLNRGDEVPSGTAEQRTRLGSRHLIAGIEKALIGMRPGGFRKVRVSPHLAYGEKGIEGVVPANAVLNISIWLRTIE